MKISVIGAGYVGLVTAACLAERGHFVESVDNDTKKIVALKNGKIPIYEPGLEELVLSNMAAGRLNFTSDLAAAVNKSEVVFIAVGTPPRAGDGDADLSYVYSVAKDIGMAIHKFTTVVTKSTVPVGTGDEIERIIRRIRPDADFAVASNPEFLRQGSAVDDFSHPDRIVVGTDNIRAREAMRDVYASFEHTNSDIIFTARRTAELIKYAANSFLAVRLSYINELADLCEAVGADVHDVALGMGLDSRIGTGFLSAGPGYGGSCFPKDTLALLRTSQDNGVPLRLVQETISINEARKRRMGQKIVAAMNGTMDGKTVAIFGLTFKANTDDMRDSPSIPLIATLQRAGAHVRAYDPHGIENARKVLSDVELFDDPYQCAEGADAAALVTDWPSLRALDFDILAAKMKGRALIDYRNAISIPKAQAAGFSVHSIGRVQSAAQTQSIPLEQFPADQAQRARVVPITQTASNWPQAR